ncbi:MAG: ATP-binding protein [Candidatus Methylomirabilales bacterium]
MGWNRLNLVQKFAILSFVCIALISLVMGTVLSRHLTKNVLDREMVTTAKVIQAQVREHDLYHLFTHSGIREDPQGVQELLAPFKNVPDVVRVKLWDRKATVLWADNTRLVGRQFPENADVRAALQGRVLAEIHKTAKPEHVHEQEKYPRLIEVYVPVVAEGTQEVLGVAEVYKDPALLFKGIREGQWMVWSVALLGGLILYLSLFAIVRGAYRTQLALEQALREHSERLEERVQARTRELSALYTVAATVSQSLDLDEVVAAALEKTLEVTRSDAGGVYLRGEDETLTLKASRGVSEEFAQRVLHLPLQEHLVGRAAELGKPLAMSIADYPATDLKPLLAREGIEAMAAVPLTSKGNSIGAMVLGKREPFPFAREELELLASIGDKIGVAVENRILYNRILQAKKEWEETFDAIPDLIFIHDKEHRILRANKALAERLGTLPEALVGKDCYDLICEADAPPPGCPAAHVFAAGAPLMREMAIPRLGGVFLISASPLSDESGALTGCVEVAKDITELKGLEQEARQKQRLEDILRFKSEFIANMSHELRTPLNAIIGFSELLVDRVPGDLNEKQAKYVHNVLESGRHLLALINDILDLSKDEAGKIELQPETFPLREALEATLTMVRPLAVKKQISLRTEIAPEASTITADPLRFKQIMFNLLSNAVKFTPEEGTVTVSATVQGPMSEVAGHREQRGQGSVGFQTPDVGHRTLDSANFVEISVQDTGIGIRPEDRQKLFQEFSQVGGEYARQQHGTGLGLALTKRLVEKHGGRIWADSAGEGKGSTFVFTLPVNAPSPAET